MGRKMDEAMERQRRRYEACRNEADLQAEFALELQQAGWEVYREVEFQCPACLSLAGEKFGRRVDIYARAPGGLYKLPVGEAVVFELKYDGPNADGLRGSDHKLGRCLWRQLVSAMAGHDWRLDGKSFERPGWAVGAFWSQLAGEPFLPWQSYLNRGLWAEGAALVERQRVRLVAGRHILRRDHEVEIIPTRLDP